MKKNILFLILSVFAVTVKACQDKELCSISAPASQVGLYLETRGDNRPLDERLKTIKMSMGFKGVKLTLLNSKDESLPADDLHIKLLKLKKDGSAIALRATLIDKKEMNEHTQGLLLALFDHPAESFMSNIEQQVKYEKVCFKISGQYGFGGRQFVEFYFSVPSKEIISDFGLIQQSEKIESIGKNEQSSFSWVKYAAIPFGLLAILSLWYFKYKH